MIGYGEFYIDKAIIFSNDFIYVVSKRLIGRFKTQKADLYIVNKYYFTKKLTYDSIETPFSL